MLVDPTVMSKRERPKRGWHEWKNLTKEHKAAEEHRWENLSDWQQERETRADEEKFGVHPRYLVSLPDRRGRDEDFS